MRNSSLVEMSCAENPTGLKPGTEAADREYGEQRPEPEIGDRRSEIVLHFPLPELCFLASGLRSSFSVFCSPYSLW